MLVTEMFVSNIRHQIVTPLRQQDNVENHSAGIKILNRSPNLLPKYSLSTIMIPTALKIVKTARITKQIFEQGIDEFFSIVLS